MRAMTNEEKTTWAEILKDDPLAEPPFAYWLGDPPPREEESTGPRQ